MKKDDQYWDKPWSLVDGCTPCSPGCERCWSAAIAWRFEKAPTPGEDAFTCQPGEEPPQYTGRVEFRHDRLGIPLKRKTPTVYSIWTDLFHEDIHQGAISDAFDVMGRCPQHIFLVLTKRAKRMSEFLHMSHYPNVWLGVTVCNQAEAYEKIPLLLQTLAAHRYISVEPMLGPIDLWQESTIDGGPKFGPQPGIPHIAVDWVICGPETGAGKRPMDEAWARSLYGQCLEANVPFFSKGDLPGLPRELPFNLSERGEKT